MAHPLPLRDPEMLAAHEDANPARPDPASARPAHDLRAFPRVDDALLTRLDRPGPRYTSYPTAPEWVESFGPDAHADALRRAAAAAGQPLSLYVHIPFCREMCSYCGCNVIVTKDPRRADSYLDAVAAELGVVAAHLGERRALSRLHLGGGTPTFLDEEQLLRLWRAINASFTVLPGAELAVEVDPVVTRPSQLALLRELGWNRLSMGVQDFEPAVQDAVNRRQTVEETRRIVDCARSLGYASVNFDLIYGLPRQTPASWRRTLDQVLALGPDRVACYSFAHVPAVKPHQRRLPIAELPAGAAKLELLRLAHEAFTSAGYRAVGIDHFARRGDELAEAAERGTLGRDFQGYTVRRAPDTIGVGVSSISQVAGVYAQNVKSLRAHAEAVAAGRLPTERGVALDDDDERRRAIIGEIMCNGGTRVSPADFAAELAALAPLARDGLVEVDGGAIALTPLGRVFARNVAMVFDARPPRVAAERPAFSRTV
jgi:oxygen-independent coproporphyrinogen-3 oxidase